MRITKNTVYVIIVAYTASFLFLQDWPAETVATGRLGTLLLGKLIVDGLFILAASAMWAGPGLISIEGDDEEAILSSKDVKVSDKLLYGLFLLNVIGNGLYHAYNVVNTTGVETSFYIVYVFSDLVVGVLFVMLWAAASRAAERARKSVGTSRGDFPRRAA